MSSKLLDSVMDAHGGLANWNQVSTVIAEIRSWTGDLPAALDRQDAVIASARLQTVQVPVSVIFGRDDPNLTPDVAQHICALFTNSEMHLIDRASHWPQWDQPDQVADLIKRSIPTHV